MAGKKNKGKEDTEKKKVAEENNVSSVATADDERNRSGEIFKCKVFSLNGPNFASYRRCGIRLTPTPQVIELDGETLKIFESDPHIKVIR